MPLPTILDEALHQGIYTQQDVENAGRRSIQGEIRDAINETNPATGLAWGAQILDVTEDENGESIAVSSYKQRELWSADDTRYNLQHKCDQLKADKRKLLDEVEWSVERFGRKILKGIKGLGEFMPEQKD